MGWPSPNIFLSTIDSDVYIRLTKVRELIHGGSLFNHDVIATNAPYGGIETPWTRPLDFILIALYQFTPADFSIEKRLLLVANWYPLIILTLITFFLNKAAETSLRSVQKLGLIAFCLVGDLIFNSHFYFMPGNTDHHSLMALLWCLSVWLILDKPSPRSAIFLGLCLGLWFWVSPEALPFLFLSLFVLGAQALLKPTLSYHPALTSGILTITIALALFIERPFHEIPTHTYLDTNSIIYVILFSFCTFGFIIFHHFISRLEDIKKRLALCGAAAISLITLFLLLFPKFIQGPLADVDPYIITNFLPRVSEATPLFQLDPKIIMSGQFLTLPALFLSLRFIKKSPKMALLFIVPMVMMIFQTRWYYYLEAISIIAIAKFLPTYARALRRKYHKISLVLHPYALITILYVIVYGLLIQLPTPKDAAYAYIDKCQFEGFQIIQSGQLVQALGETPLTLESNILGNTGISFFTPYNYVAGYYHREGAGLKVKNKILDATNIESARQSLKERNVTALMICPTAYPSWVNSYFENTPPKSDWVTINTHIKRPEGIDIKEYPVLLNIRP